MPWNYDQMQTLPIANLERFSDPISDEYDNHVSTKILEIIGKIESSSTQPFIYFAIGTANKSINYTNPSSGKYVTEPNIQRQQYPERFIQEMNGRGYTCYVINIDSFPDKSDTESASVNKFFINGAFPLGGTVVGRGTKTPETITATVNLFKSTIGKGGKVLILNCATEAGNGGLSIFQGIYDVLIRCSRSAPVIYASSFLERGPDYNLFKLAYPQNKLFIPNLNVPELTYDEVFGAFVQNPNS